MEKQLRQIVEQVNIDNAPHRLLIQYNCGLEKKQIICDYDNLSEKEKSIVDAYRQMCESKIKWYD